MNLQNCKSKRSRLNKNNKKVKALLQFKHTDIEQIMHQINSDNTFLQNKKFIDYSVLLAVERKIDLIGVEDIDGEEMNY